MRCLRRIAFFSILLAILYSVPSFSYQAPVKEFNHLLSLIWDSDHTPHPIGDLIPVLIQDKQPLNAYVVLYPISPEQHAKYKAVLIDDQYMKVLVMRVYSSMDDNGNTLGLFPFSQADIDERLKSTFDIPYPDFRIRLHFENNELILSSEILVEFADDVPMSKRFPALEFMKQGIEEAWQGTVSYQGKDVPFKTHVMITDCLFSFGNRNRLDRFHVFISEKIVRSFVKRDQDWFRYGRWEVPHNSIYETKQLYAHEFGHFIGFNDAYTDVAYFDLNGNLLSNTVFDSLPIQSSLKLLSPFSWITEFDKIPPEHYQNIMASSRFGHVLPEHLFSIVRAYTPMMQTARETCCGNR